MRNATKIALAAMLALALSGLGAEAQHTTCPQLILFTGQATGVENPTAPGTDIRNGLNIGSFGSTCTNHAVDADTFYITPGSTHVWGATAKSNTSTAPTGGSISFNGGSGTSVAFHDNSLRSRWETRSLAIPANASTIKLTATFGGSTKTLTIRKAA